MKEICLKNDTKVAIRDGKKEDAQAVIDFYNEVGGETPFLSFGKGEYKASLADTESGIESSKSSDNSVMLIAFVGDEIASIATIDSNQKAKGKHVGVLGIVVKEKYWGIGLGKELMIDLIEWCKGNGITKKITLVTNEENTKAIELYKKVGFGVDAILVKENFYGGEYTNLVRMSLLLGI
ncbi:GNAT family N-acetyltransferase [Metaclostridioides mangenotii]|jgi:RimJ/RimL family protein N-acetyltransferase|uniref:RimJ/RimL family protein N-acetyltransferase n=1 Tax=Metaclostridioides mangenotii TaxID=1540 RepID=A0ABS4E9K9_9FIRM|nr:GNAT family N-acetyltransferase [Clostridioides mangenotii]MBP1854628.1 RimJ/RimL family protein N-acetyltransferase [Clostridioides mangenotii]